MLRATRWIVAPSALERLHGGGGRLTGFAAALAIGALTLAAGLPACSSSSPPREVTKRNLTPARDVPEFLRATIGAETTLRGAEPVLVSGLGLVVGLSGTGGGEMPPNVADTLERELALNGVGKGTPNTQGGPLEGVTPEEFLRSKNVAVVIVEAQISPGTPVGSRFDVFVRTLPGSSVTSLEGGRLWTTDLRIGPAAVFGARKTRKLAEAAGAVFINPFSETLGGATAARVADSRQAVTRTIGRVLGGGAVTDPLQLEMALDTPSHSRARSMVSALNTRFPEGPGDEGPTARGRAGDSIAIRVPREFAENPEDFVQLIRFLRIDSSFAETAVERYLTALREEPSYAREIMWCLTALGPIARGQLVKMYDYPELAPRMAALEAGARLGDPRTVAPLTEIARSAPATPMRLAAMDLLAGMGGNPNINFAIRELLSAPQLEVRVAAYETLSKLRDPSIDRTELAGNDPRQAVMIIEQVPSPTSMVYVTQQGEPRIAVFGGRSITPDGRLQGEPLRLSRPLLATMWNDRLMITAESGGDIRVRFSDELRGKTMETTAPDTLPEFITFLTRKQTPEDPRPGLGLGYSEVVAVLFELTRQQGLAAVFATEEDKLRAQVFAAANNTVLSDRPEDSDKAEDIAVQVFRPTAPIMADGSKPDADPDQPKRSKIVPLGGTAKPKKP